MTSIHSPEAGTAPQERPADRPGARPGGRSARVRAAVHRAVAELLAESGTEAVSVPTIAARAGVHATTVYRRWGSVGELMTEVARSRFAGEVVVPHTGTLRGDLELWMRDVATDLADPDTLAIMRATIGVGGVEGGCACAQDRHEQLAAIVAADHERGGVVRDVDAAADLLLGPLYYRALFVDRPAPEGWAAELVGTYLSRDAG